MGKDQEIYELRKLLWAMHGHKGIYGDDGELQCHQCWHEYGFYDWKREPIENILKGIQEGNLRKLANPSLKADKLPSCQDCGPAGQSLPPSCTDDI